MANENEKNIPEQTPEAQNEQPSRYSVYRSVKVGLKPGYVLRKVGQAYMVMPTGPRMKDYQGMITLNETGAFLYKETEKEGTTRETLIEACKKEYDASDEEADMAVNSFINQCADCGLFEVNEAVYDNEEGKMITVEEFRKRMAEKMAESKNDE